MTHIVMYTCQHCNRNQMVPLILIHIIVIGAALIQSLCLFQAPEGESQPMTEVDLFISTQRIKVLTADTQVCFSSCSQKVK